MTGPQLFRIRPKLSIDAYKTYELRAPVATHFRVGRCEEVEAVCSQTNEVGEPSCFESHCPQHAHGWRTLVDVSTELGRRQAAYIGKSSDRHYALAVDGDLHTYTFPAGQQCFATHQVPLGRDPILIVRDGDWRGNPTGRTRTHVRPADWTEDFAEHQQELADEIAKG